MEVDGFGRRGEVWKVICGEGLNSWRRSKGG